MPGSVQTQGRECWTVDRIPALLEPVVPTNAMKIDKTQVRSSEVQGMLTCIGGLGKTSPKGHI